ncbi:MAG: nodulation protein NfeD, partial [Actinomycetota bacterium]|nr:nodulation protein NfeD [Actinomycetota bacterium]
MTVRRCLAGRAVRRCGALLVLAGLLVGVLATTAGAHGDGTLVDVVEVEGVIDPAVAGYLRDAVATAEADGAEVLIVQLDTPGGLGVAVDELVQLVTTSRVPVVVWVGPPGARAASTGMYLGYAAHVLALAPA